MNAAAKVINQSNLFNGHLADMHMSKSIYLLTVLLIAVLVSAFAVIYSTNSYRSTFSQVEQEEQQAHHLQLQWGQLLLEQASLATPARIEEFATEKLKMILPNSNNTYLLHAQVN
jgi:cell division protein FtsL